MSVLAECIFFSFWDIKNSGQGVQEYRLRWFFFFREGYGLSVCLSLCYFIRTIK